MLTGLLVSQCFNFYERISLSLSLSPPLSLCTELRLIFYGDAVINRVLIGQ